jgi:hypothetical protein
MARVIAGLTNFDGFTRGRTAQDKLSSLGTEIVERFIEETIALLCNNCRSQQIPAEPPRPRTRRDAPRPCPMS